MAWQVSFSPAALKNLDALDNPVATRILRFLDERIKPSENPRSLGEALQGSRLGDLWKYRVGDYRVVANIKDQEFEVLVVKIGNRREVYR